VMNHKSRIAPQTNVFIDTSVAMPTGPPTHATQPHPARGADPRRFAPRCMTMTADSHIHSKF
jgi:hypothetical protein